MKQCLWGLAVGLAVSAMAAEPAPKTVITSQVVRVLDQGRAVEFTGDVRLTRGNDFLSADRLITEEDNTIAQAWGLVYLRRYAPNEGARWECRGDRGVYDTETSSGTVWGTDNPARAWQDPWGPDVGQDNRLFMEAPEITFTEVLTTTGPVFSFSVARGRGGVYLHQVEDTPHPRDTRLWAEQADYDGVRGCLSLRGAFVPWPGRPLPGSAPADMDRPLARQMEKSDVRWLRGRRVDFYPIERRLVVQSEVWCRLYYESDPDSDKSISRLRRKGSGGDGSAR